MTSCWEKMKNDPARMEKHKDYMKDYNKKKYDTNPEYREYMREKARKRRAMLRELKKST